MKLTRFKENAKNKLLRKFAEVNSFREVVLRLILALCYRIISHIIFKYLKVISYYLKKLPIQIIKEVPMTMIIFIIFGLLSWYFSLLPQAFSSPAY